MFAPGLRRSDIEQAIGDSLRRLHSEPLRAWCARRSIAACRSTRSSRATRSRSQLKKLILPQAGAKAGQGRRAARQESSSCRGRVMPDAAQDDRSARTSSHGWSLHNAPRRRSGARAGGRGVPRSKACPGRCFRRLPTPEPATPAAANPLLTDKLLDAKVRLHRRLIEEINLSALEKLPEDEIRNHIQQLVSQYIAGRAARAQYPGTQRFRLGNPRRDDGPRPARAAAQGSDRQRYPDQRPRMRLCRAHAACSSRPACASRTRRICCASSTRSSPRSAAASMNRIRCATRACSTARASTSRCGRWRSTARWSRSANSPRSRSTSTSWSRSARCGRKWPSCWRPPSRRASR